MVDPNRKETIDIVGKWINWELNAGKFHNFTEKSLTVSSILLLRTVFLNLLTIYPTI